MHIDIIQNGDMDDEAEGTISGYIFYSAQDKDFIKD